MPSFWSAITAVLLLCSACQGSPVERQPTPTPEGTPSVPLTTLPPIKTSIPAATPTAEPTAVLQILPADLKGQQIHFWHSLTGASASQLDELVRQFNLRNEWGIQVLLTSQGAAGPLANAVDQARADDLPEVVLAPSEQLAEWQHTKAFLVDLNLYLGQETWGMAKSELDGYLPLFWKQDQFAMDGPANPVEQIGIPALRTATGLIYNRSFAADLGYQYPPQTTQNLLDQACAASKKNNTIGDRVGTGGWMLDTTSLSALSWMAVFGADVVPETADGNWNFDQPEAVDALRFLRGMQEKGCLWESKHPTPYEYFGDRRSLFFTATLQDLVLQAGYVKKIASKDEWTMIPFPGSDGKPVLYSSGYSYGVLGSPSPARQMAAWLFVRWMSQPDNQVRLASAWVSFPVSEAVQAGLDGKKSDFPWNVILPLEPVVRPAPSLASWLLVRRPLEDAFWQLFNLASSDQIPQLLPELDQMTAEMIRSQK